MAENCKHILFITKKTTKNEEKKTTKKNYENHSHGDNAFVKNTKRALPIIILIHSDDRNK